MPGHDLSPILSLPEKPEERWDGAVLPLMELLGMPAPRGAASDQPMLALWRSEQSGLLHARPFAGSLGDLDMVLEQSIGCLVDFHTLHEFPFRPPFITSGDKRLAEGLKKELADSGLEVRYEPKEIDWNEVMAALADQLNRFLDAEGPAPSFAGSKCSKALLHDFASAAAAFYRARLWIHLDDTDLIKMETPKPPKEMRFATVLGAGGETFGLGFYTNAEDHYDMRVGLVDPLSLSLMSLTFNSTDGVAAEDLQLWDDLELPLEDEDAFPSLTKLSDGVPGPATPKQVEYAAIVLQALAETTEAELDSGAWTKSVEIGGKRKECRLSIPNLTDPPTREEWIDRGFQPETQEHERYFQKVQEFIASQQQELSLEDLNKLINEKFTGRSLAEFETPPKTHAERAAIKCQEALSTFGRRRIQLIRKALEEDPNHVESLVQLAELTRDREERLVAYQRAVDVGRKELGEQIETEAGHFWGILETRPFMRACHGLAVMLNAVGRTDDAIAQYQEMLHLNPNDNQGIRYELMALLIVNDRGPEAAELMDRYVEDFALWHHLKSLAEFRAHGRGSQEARQAIRAAFKANEHVVPLLQSGNYSPPAAYARGSMEEAANVIDEMEDSWDATTGYLDFMYDEFQAWRAEKKKRRGSSQKGVKRSGAKKRRKR